MAITTQAQRAPQQARRPRRQYAAVEADTGWTIRDLELFPDPLDDKRYEIIAGRLYVSTQPHVWHQATCARVVTELLNWSDRSSAGNVIIAPGVIFDEREAVAPDVVWVRSDRWDHVADEDGKLHDAPDLVVEVLSPGTKNRQRDRQVKLELYSRRGVPEYWILDWRQRTLDVYRREGGGLRHAATLREADTLESPILPGFTCLVRRLFPPGTPPAANDRARGRGRRGSGGSGRPENTPPAASPAEG
jgi:Uma2 family endonuclease